jgi:hypothetical protein
MRSSPGVGTAETWARAFRTEVSHSTGSRVGSTKTHLLRGCISSLRNLSDVARHSAVPAKTPAIVGFDRSSRWTHLANRGRRREACRAAPAIGALSPDSFGLRRLSLSRCGSGAGRSALRSSVVDTRATGSVYAARTIGPPPHLFEPSRSDLRDVRRRGLRVSFAEPVAAIEPLGSSVTPRSSSPSPTLGRPALNLARSARRMSRDTASRTSASPVGVVSVEVHRG